MTEGEMDWRETGDFSWSALYLYIQPQEVVMESLWLRAAFRNWLQE